MKNLIRSLLLCSFVAGSLATPRAARAQSGSQRGQPKTPFAVSDLAKLRWIDGTWEATAPGETTLFERYRFANDSTIEITYFGDSTLSRATGTGRVYLTMGRIYHTFGPGRWGATHVDSSGIYFIPQVSAHNSFAWSYQSPDAWTSTMRTGLSGHTDVIVYQMRRLKGR